MYDLDKKIIFTHPPKCGGTSIEDKLGFLLLREKHPSVHAFKHGSLEMHVNAMKQKGFRLKPFFKFSIIRNPWDRSVSFYNHTKYKEYYYYLNEVPNIEMPLYVKDSIKLTFKEFVLKYFKKNFNSDVSTKPYMFFNNRFFLDYVIKLEFLKTDINLIKDKLQINLDIPHLNNSDQYIERKDYREYYDDETEDFVRNMFKWDIEEFGYKF